RDEIVANPKSCDGRHWPAFEQPRTRWYHYALRRLPLSLLISFLTLFFLIPMLLLVGLTVCRWFVG
ncbi:MAG: hypothetical protein ACI9HK_002272, partial [Pirellulaceae bacterium]